MASSVALAFDILARDKASKTFNNIGDSAEKTGGRVQGMAKTAVKAFAGLAVAAKAKDFFADSIAGARESIEIDKETARVIKTMGGAANVTADDVEKLSNKLQKQQTISDEVVQAGANLLLTFGNIRNEMGEGNDVFDRSVALAGDMATVLKTDTKSAALQLGKALNDPIKGLSALSRSGVSFTEQQKEQVKAMVAAGDTLGAQKLILGELDKQFGGSAAAQADNAKKLGLAWSDFQEVIGRAVLPVVDMLIGALTVVARWAADNPAQFKAVAAVIGGVLAVAFTAWAVSAASAAAATIAAAAPVIAITAAIAALAAGVIWAYQNWDFFRNAVDTVARFLTGTLWPAIQTGVRFLTNDLVPAIGSVISWFGQLVGKAAEVAVGVTSQIGSIVTFIAGLPDRISRVARGIFEALKTAAQSAASYVIRQLDRMLGPIDEALGKIGSVVAKAGGLLGKIPGFATGVLNFSGGLALVGEEGPELLNLPRGSNVIPTPTTLDMLTAPRQAAPLVGGDYIVQVLPEQDPLRRGMYELERIALKHI